MKDQILKIVQDSWAANKGKTIVLGVIALIAVGVLLSLVF